MADETETRTPHPFDLDLRALDALPEERRQALDRALAADPELRAAADAHDDACRSFESQVFPRTIDAVEERSRGRRWSGRLLVPTALAAATALLLMIVSGEERRPLDEAGLVAKGDPILQVVAQRGEEQFAVAPGVELQAEDALKFVVQPINYRYVLIVAIDASGRAQVWYPFDGNESAPVRGRTELEGSVILDDTAGEETVVAVFSNAPESAKEWRERLENSRDLEAKGDTFVVSVRWSKRSTD